MPYAFVHLISKKEDLTVAQFKNHMETRFAPLMKEVCGPLFPLKWTRRYMTPLINSAHEEGELQKKPGSLGLPALLVGLREEIGWDCLSEMTFHDELHFNQYFALINEETPAERLMHEERLFSDITKLKFIIMEAWTDENEHVTKRDS